MNKRIFSVLLALLLLVTSAMPVAAAKNTKVEKEPVSIESVEQLLQFAEDCRLDAYSQDLTVSLETDLDLSEVAFRGVPIFCGTFQGNGHTISGLHMTAEGSYQGLFRYLTADALVQNLIVEGEVSPQGSRGYVGGLAGRNAGSVVNCAFHGTVSGTEVIGGIAGLNAVTGIIENCTVTGTISGSHFIGGVAGENTGVIRSCVNEARINATASENRVELSEITIESLTGSESSASATDIGGIAGNSSGVIRNCVNEAVVGYRNMGYNIGGIAGTQSGYLVDCENNGDVYGRKEVGGIVGHMEPFSELEYSQDALQILEGQLNSLSAMTSQAGSKAVASANSISGEVDRMQGYTDTAMDAINALRPGANTDPDSITAAQGALSSSVTGITNSMGQLSAAANDTASGLSQDMMAISNQINAMSNTLKSASSSVGGDFTDISDADLPTDTGGKVDGCENYGTVFGDMNIGGITGAMAMENDLDAQEDWTVTGNESMNLSGEIRAVIVNCENKGTVSAGKKQIGGIVGWQYMGLVKDSVNVGVVDAVGADYVGGISGYSSGYIRDCGSKCAIYGDTYVGGIAGIAGIVTDCHSMVEIHGAVERVGAVLGLLQSADTEEEQPVSGNYYLVTEADFGGIDGISYVGLAEPMVIEEFVTMESVSTPFQTVTLCFVFEQGEPVEITVPLGGSVAKEDIPAIPEKSGYVSQWEGLADVDLNQVLFDMEFRAQYIGQTSVLAADVLRENGMPILLVQGMFTDDTRLKVTQWNEAPDVAFGYVLHEVWKVSVTEGTPVSGLRYRIPNGGDAEHFKMYISNKDNQWRSCECTVDGSYAVVPFNGDDIAIAYAQGQSWSYVLVVLVLGALLVARQYRDRLPKKKK